MTVSSLMRRSSAAVAVSAVMASAPAAAQAVVADDASQYLFNTLLFLVAGMVVMFMAAGFCMLEVGLVRAKNAATICVKNIALYSIAGLMVWLVGFDIIYGGDEAGFIGAISIWAPNDGYALEGGTAVNAETWFASSSEWYFQMVFVATAASIVSGALAERIKLAPFLLFTAALTGLIYPLQAHWKWGEGFLHTAVGFADFAGSTLVHSTGGWAALAGALVLGPRVGRYVNGRATPFPGSSLPLATLGAFILWLGWFGFNGGSQLAFGRVEDAIAVATIIVNTNMAACAGVLTAMFCTQLLYKKIDLTIVLNGAIGGLVSITAEPLTPAVWQAVLIGGVGGAIVTYAVPLLDRLRVDDVVGAIPAHLFCGVWGTMAVPLSNSEASWLAQAAGILIVGGFVFSSSLALWAALRYTIGLRAQPDDESIGLDRSELGQEAYPEFVSS